MIYNSFLFVWLFPILFVIGNNLTIRYRKYFLLLSSYALYINYNQWMSLILLSVSLISFTFAHFIDKKVDCNQSQSDSNDKEGKGLLFLGILGTIAPLITFKYYDFIACNLNEIDIHLPSLSIVTPLGVSFYTFQALSYLFDVYRKKYKSAKNILNYMTFLSFFPSMIAGPINRYNELMPQINTHQCFDRPLAEKGLKMILWGMFLKVVVADRLQLYVDPVFADYQHYSGSSLLMAYTIGGKQMQQATQLSQHLDHLFGKRNLAWSQLDFYILGIIAWHQPSCGKDAWHREAKPYKYLEENRTSHFHLPSHYPILDILQNEHPRRSHNCPHKDSHQARHAFRHL